MNTSLLLCILFSHFVADFICQTDEDAKNKSHSFMHLSHHIYCYFMAMFGVLGLAVQFFDVKFLPFVSYIGINALAHLVIDYFTSKGTAYLYKKGDVHNFFVVIGFDQFLHAATLILTMGVLG